MDGILYLAFGAEFDKVGAAVAEYSRKYTDLPMHVITNLTSPRPWPEGTTFTHWDMPSVMNRGMKVSLFDHTPFDRTLFIDSDAVIQRPGIERYFTDLDHHDLACQHAETIDTRQRREGKRFYERYYLSLMDTTGEPYPLEILQSSAFLWRQTPQAKAFFGKWRELWELGGRRRDMPGFSLAARTPGLTVKTYYPKRDGFLANMRNPERVIQHRGYGRFLCDFNLPEYKDWNP
jgi:hypothetical protein